MCSLSRFSKTLLKLQSFSAAVQRVGYSTVTVVQIWHLTWLLQALHQLRDCSRLCTPGKCDNVNSRCYVRIGKSFPLCHKWETRGTVLHRDGVWTLISCFPKSLHQSSFSLGCSFSFWMSNVLGVSCFMFRGWWEEGRSARMWELRFPSYGRK